MKLFSTILLATLIFIFGCDTPTDISVNTAENNFQTSLSKIADFELIPLPDKSALWMDSMFSMSKEINGSAGGRLIMEKYYISEDGDSVIIEADLRIPPGAFQGTETITMTVDAEYAAIHFYPEMIFDDTLKFTHRFKGLSLNGYSTGTIDFVFINDDGTIELIKKNGVQVIIPQGMVRVINAHLLHFSRFGWIRKMESIGVYPIIEVE